MKVTKGIMKTFEQYMAVKNKEHKLMSELYKWMSDQGIDTSTNEFADAIAARIGYNEFDSAEHFFDELKRYIDGEQVGYGYKETGICLEIITIK
ncbi:hypothetical protein HUB98_05810 [Paenibacillus barcinonensis]|uniref:Uncharacterized protein n=1 Tax=Paenibacillus barcinonensis TaxID=198119 RepID=A0A2V4W873_PAEBA|nr:hypothetical protein [Paenibacillus barcinonensis]PYE51513.1 hypothetical protein DFQ00_102307 [Paenibacillus barcinonensis]QKS55896.1 hypothetical protein HUB98_05810 [Paenibacillus barcinonensis]